METKAATEAWRGRLGRHRDNVCKGPEVERKLEGQGPAKIWDTMSERRVWVTAGSPVQGGVSPRL